MKKVPRGETVWNLRIKEFARDMRETRRLGKKNNLRFLASGVAFLSLLSLCPFLILCFGISQYFLRQINAENTPPAAITLLLNSILPTIDPSISVGILTILKQNAIRNLFNLLLLGWSVYELFSCLHIAFTNISARGNVRNAVWTHVVSLLAFLIVTGSSTIFLMASTIDPYILKKIFHEYLGNYQAFEIKIIAGVFAFATITTSLTFIYKLMPTQKIAWINAFCGSLLFLVLFFLGRATYHLYVTYYRFISEGTFGPFFTFIMVIVWIYFVSRIFLFSAQYAVYLQERAK
jgi:membrane protein